jgi:mono/diheme cytochrome c family protein
MLRLYPLFFIALLIAGCAIIDPDPEAVVVRPTAPDTSCSYSNTLTGARLFACHCSGCHGDDGRPVLEGVPDMTLRTVSYGHFDTVLTEGPGISPRFPQLDSIARKKLYAFVASLKR